MSGERKAADTAVKELQHDVTENKAIGAALNDIYKFEISHGTDAASKQHQLEILNDAFKSAFKDLSVKDVDPKTQSISLQDGQGNHYTMDKEHQVSDDQGNHYGFKKDSDGRLSLVKLPGDTHSKEKAEATPPAVPHPTDKTFSDANGTKKKIEYDQSEQISKITEELPNKGGTRIFAQTNGQWQLTDEKGAVTRLAEKPSLNSHFEITYKTEDNQNVTEKMDGSTVYRNADQQITQTAVRNKDGSVTRMNFDYTGSDDGQPTAVRIHDSGGEWELDRLGNWPVSAYKDEWTIKHNGENTALAFDPTGLSKNVPFLTGTRSEIRVDQTNGDFSYTDGTGRSYNYHTNGSVDVGQMGLSGVEYTHLSKADKSATPTY
jgi:hypothetical protein